MITTVYVETAVREHPRTTQILTRLPRATVVECERYGEVFNRRRQSFRLQKRNPSLILARKQGEHVLPTPAGYGVGGARNFYFSHMLNCPYDCRYCFLQGMYRSAHQVLFVDYESFFESMSATAEDTQELQASQAETTSSRAGGSQSPEQSERCWFFSGYDCDSLAFEGISGFAEACLDAFARAARDEAPLSRSYLELRTKSASIEPLLRRAPLPNVVVAYSLSPTDVAEQVEHKAPSVERRLVALERLQAAGWPIGLRFDPLLWRPDFEASYDGLFRQVFNRLDVARIHSVSLGVFRLPRDFHRRLVRLYPDEALLAMPMEEHEGMVSYRNDLEKRLFEGVRDQLLTYIEPEQYFPCLS